MPLLILNNINDLNRHLSAQRMMNRRALRDLDAIIEDIQDLDESKLMDELLRREKALIAEYAKSPTLADFARNPGLSGIAHWGTTFCVALLFSEVVLGNVRMVCDHFTKSHRLLAMLLMKEIDNPDPDATDLVESALSFMNIELRQDVNTLTEEERKRLIRTMLAPLVLAMLNVLTRFDLAENIDNQGYRLTDTGRNVLAHLFDAQRFIDEVVEAHERLKKQIPVSC